MIIDIRISKKDEIPLGHTIGYRIFAIITALIVCSFIIIGITGLNPLGVFREIINGAWGTNRRFWVTIRDMLVLFLVAEGLVPAFKMRFWNIGAEGQILMGGLASAMLMIYLPFLPHWLLLTAIIIASCLAGMLWGIIPAIFKAKYNTNESLFTLMMNYIAIQLITFCIVFWENPAGSNTVGIINGTTNAGWFPPVFGLKYGVNILLVIIAVSFIKYYLTATKQGYELAVVGESWNTAKYAGIQVSTVIIRTMAVSGAICGLAGALVVSGASHTISTSLAGGRGFTAIIVTWMSSFNTLSMLCISLLLVTMENGAIQIATQFGLNENVSEILTGIIIFFLISSDFFIHYSIAIQKKKKETQK
ncbi:MAG: ABC transporter permease [Treponema sp.]|nr:ABC transporter permease [Treponema sp.]